MDIFALPHLIPATATGDNVIAYYTDEHANYAGEFISSYSLIKNELDTPELVPTVPLGFIWSGLFYDAN